MTKIPRDEKPPKTSVSASVAEEPKMALFSATGEKPPKTSVSAVTAEALPPKGGNTSASVHTSPLAVEEGGHKLRPPSLLPRAVGVSPQKNEDQNPITIFIPGNPITCTAQQKGVRVVRGRPFFYEKPEVQEARRKYQKFFRRQSKPLLGPVWIDVTFIFPLRRQDGNPCGHIPMDSRPDIDNLCKLLLDEMTASGYWHDDGQIADLSVHKRRGSETCTIITAGLIDPQNS